MSKLAHVRATLGSSTAFVRLPLDTPFDMAPSPFYCQSVVSELVQSLREAELQSLAATCRHVEPIARAWFPAHLERVRLRCLAAACTARFEIHSGRWVEVPDALAQALFSAMPRWCKVVQGQKCRRNAGV
ncbi:unnamed protein product [Polarella glacialis]|uniref:Uncharacterized protein n=1 Tax=Polarella glacialis TaxID=89957 RepID=A0A813IC27_POLGL|nr:unnamed protein product [Polarella glacialis]